MGIFDFFFPPSKSRQDCKKKRRFTSDSDAQAALRRINPAKKPGKPVRAYKCPDCNGYHLTSQRQ